MARLLGLQEVGTVCSSVGQLAVGEKTKAGNLWREYREESVLGSGVCAIGSAVCGNGIEARRLVKGMGRATGQSIAGGGLLRDVPVLHELAVCGESLGDVIAGGDHKAAARRWTEAYQETSVLSNAVVLATEKDEEERKRRSSNSKVASTKAVISVAAAGAALGIAAGTGGLGAAAIPIICTSGGAACGATTAANEAISFGKVDKGDVVGAFFMGSAVGGAAELPVPREIQEQIPSPSAWRRNKPGFDTFGCRIDGEKQIATPRPARDEAEDGWC